MKDVLRANGLLRFKDDHEVRAQHHEPHARHAVCSDGSIMIQVVTGITMSKGGGGGGGRGKKVQSGGRLLVCIPSKSRAVMQAGMLFILSDLAYLSGDLGPQNPSWMHFEGSRPAYLTHL